MNQRTGTQEIRLFLGELVTARRDSLQPAAVFVATSHNDTFPVVLDWFVPITQCRQYQDCRMAICEEQFDIKLEWMLARNSHRPNIGIFIASRGQSRAASGDDRELGNGSP